MAPNQTIGGRSVLLVSVLCLAACQSALIYGERTSFNLAAIQLNDEVSEPVKISFGFSRSVTTVAPPRVKEETVNSIDDKGRKTSITIRSGEAVSVFSNFDLDYLGNRKEPKPPATLPLTDQDLNIRTRFASGQAAIEVASNTQVVAAILGVRTVGPDTPEVHARKQKLSKCVTAIKDNEKLKPIAKQLGVTPNEDSAAGTAAQITSRIDQLNVLELGGLEQVDPLKSCQ